MKKLLFFVAALFTVSFAQAQEGLKLGLKAGGNLSTLVGDDVEDVDNRFGIHFGAFLDYGVSEMVSIRPEVLYSMKGAKIAEDDMDGGFNFHYIDVPVLVRINADRLFFELGPTFSYLVKSDIEMEEVSVDFKDYTKTVDVGYAAGIGYQFLDNIGLGLRYNGGLSNIFKDDEEGSPFGEAKIRNSVFQLSLSYTFGGR